MASSFRYHQIVLSGQHPRSPSRETCKTECRWSEGTSQIVEKGTLQGVANNTASVLRPIARQRGLRLVEQGPRRYLGHDEAGRGRVLMRPDIALLDVDGRPMAILDTKWKRLETQNPLSGLSSADLYQMASYSASYHCRKVALLYPEQIALTMNQGHKIRLKGALSAELLVLSTPIDLAPTPSTCQTITNALMPSKKAATPQTVGGF
nr:McrC family protein [Wenzhouxiangella limi]